MKQSGVFGVGAAFLWLLGSNAIAEAPISEPEGSTQRVASALSQASAAYESGNRKALARALISLENMGAHPLHAGAEDPMIAWRQMASGKGGRKPQPLYRGRPLGPGFRSGKLRPGGVESFSQLFLSGETANIAVSSPTGSRVTMKVADPQAQPVCNEETQHAGGCRWVPVFTQRYTIEVANPGNKDASYFLVVN